MIKTKVCGNCHKEKSVAEFHRRNTIPSGRVSCCKVCAKKKGEMYRINSREKYLAYGAQYRLDNRKAILKGQARYRKDNREKIKQHLKTLRQQWEIFVQADKMKCSSCGYNRCFAVLQYHHMLPKEKDFNISTLMKKAFIEKNKGTMMKELGKCICLCANCHFELHEKIKTLKQQEEANGI